MLLCGAYSRQSLLLPIGGTKPTLGGNTIIPEVASPILYKGLIYAQTGYCQLPIGCFNPQDGKAKFITTESKTSSTISWSMANSLRRISGEPLRLRILPDRFQLLGNFTPPTH